VRASNVGDVFASYDFNYKGERGALGVSEPDEAKRRFSTIKAQIDNGTFQKAKPQRGNVRRFEKPTFAVVGPTTRNDGLT
jgi:hypothetical protein